MFSRILMFIALLALAVSAYAQSQADMNQTACNEYKKADQKLTDTYDAISKTYASDPLFLKNLEASQKTWLASEMRNSK